MTARTPLTKEMITKKTNVSVSPVFLDDAIIVHPRNCVFVEPLGF